jgi:hypothetical protein
MITNGRTRGVVSTREPPESETGDAVLGKSPNRRKLIITIDTEALPLRRPSQHVEQLIWGRFGDNEAGLKRLMAIAERHASPLTFFVDLCELPLYPGAFESVCQAILTQGHDLQLHAHPHILPQEFCGTRGLSNSSLHLQPPEKGLALLTFLSQSAVSLAGIPPVAFRGGAFAYNEGTLAAMARHKVLLGFNYHINCPYQSNNIQNLPTFRWSNGIVEFPMSYLRFRGQLQAFEFSSTSRLEFNDLDMVHAFMKQFFTELGSDAVLVLLMHSWSFLYLNRETGYFEYRDNLLAEQFEHFLASLPRDLEVITASQAARLVQTGSLAPALVRDVDLANFAKYGCALAKTR